MASLLKGEAQYCTNILFLLYKRSMQIYIFVLQREEGAERIYKLAVPHSELAYLASVDPHRQDAVPRSINWFDGSERRSIFCRRSVFPCEYSVISGLIKWTLVVYPQDSVGSVVVQQVSVARTLSHARCGPVHQPTPLHRIVGLSLFFLLYVLILFRKKIIYIEHKYIYTIYYCLRYYIYRE